MDRPFTVLIEPFKGCNLACRYCYSEVASRESMSLDTLQVVLERLVEFLDGEGIGLFNLTWHGGEPMMAGRAFFESAFALCDRMGLSGRVTHLMQTNGTLLDEEWCRLILKRGLQVSLSLDGPRDITNATRPGDPGFDTFSHVMEKSELLHRHGIRHAFMVVVTRANVDRPRELYDFFRGLGATFKVNPVMVSPYRREAQDELGVTAAAYGRFLCQLFDVWMADPETPIRVGTLDTYLKNVMAGRAFNCQHSERCSDFIVGVRPDGTVNPCTRFQLSSTRSLHNHSLRELRSESPFTEIARRSGQLAECRKCEFLTICHGGCPQHAEAFYGDCLRKDYFCPAYKLIYAHIRDFLKAQG